MNRWERGQFVVMLAAAILGLLGCAGLATDLGYLEFVKLRLQNIADAAAIAGELEICDARPDGVRAAALDAAKLNGFARERGASIELNRPPTFGPHAGDSTALQVSVTQVEPAFLLRALGFRSLRVSARAIATQKASPLCVIALSRDAAPAIAFSGAAALGASCAILANSSAPNALAFDSDLSIDAPAIASASFASSGTGAARVLNRALPAPDPFALHQRPRYSGCDHLNYETPLVGKVVLSPGVFCNGIVAPASSTASIAFRPGLYVIRGGGIILGNLVQFRNRTGGDDGVTFYLTGDASYPYRGVVLDERAGGTLSAPRGGAFEGMLFYQDPAIPPEAAANSPSIITGGSRSTYQGVLYFPTSHLIYGGGHGAYTVIVADRITFNLLEPTVIGKDYSSLAHGAPIKTATLSD